MKNFLNLSILKLFNFFLLTVAGNAAAQSRYIEGVDEYVPAPGQFVNTLPEATADDTPESMAQKCTALLAKGAGGMVTLGAYGGYITFHFDHPVQNVAGERDFAVWGNAFLNNAEPAIVMVAVDANGNGLPDDTWYELKGSEYDNPLTVHDYQITYTYDALQAVAWTDNQGETGSVPRNRFHTQEYFPLWLSGEGTLTLSGNRLPDNAIAQQNANGSTTFLLPAYDFGYADNQPNTDVEGCSMDIGWAVDEQGQPANLSHIDFVRCYNAMNQVCGAIGETSTEITGAEDLHPDAPGNAGIKSQTSDLKSRTSDNVYDLQGRRQQQRQLSRGLYIVDGRLELRGRR